MITVAVGEKYQPYTSHTLDKIPQISYLGADERHAVEVVSQVLPFRTNSFVLNNLIDWNNIPNDPMFTLTFPQRDMLSPVDFEAVSNAMRRDASAQELQEIVHKIRLKLNPHPAGQLEYNVPRLSDNSKMEGIQHKYDETVLFFPKEGQTCHAYCTWCFRWPQFVNMDDLKFASNDAERLVQYLRENPTVTDILITGGDPLIMRTSRLKVYLEALVEANIDSLKNIRIGTKAISYWPYRFLTDKDADELMALFEYVVDSGKHLAIMAHVNHPHELDPEPVRDAIRRIQNTGAVIRTQSPVLRHVNDDAHTWATMWDKQVSLGIVPYYFFVARDTGAQHFFALPLIETWQIFRDAYSSVSGLSRTVRGPSMSATPGKVQILGTTEVAGNQAFVLQYLQARDSSLVKRPFLAEYDPNAIWFDELKPLYENDKHFFKHLL